VLVPDLGTDRVELHAFDALAGTLDHRPEGALVLPPGFAGLRSGAALGLAPSGRFLYATTRSHGTSGMPPAPGIDSLVWFAIDPDGTAHPAGRMASGGGIARACAWSAWPKRCRSSKCTWRSKACASRARRNGSPTNRSSRSARWQRT
jgi:6-phosphogluconolactonase (cycloisomerase 2 family)